MSRPDTFGDTISNGIQDISALLPLLGTEQCERHVGAALENGYLYAAASPLSIFGSLGIVKTAFATFLGTMTSPFNGGSWLHDAGFGTTGSVASMVTIIPGTKRYGAEVRLQQLMKDQHIDDPAMLSDIELVGSQRNSKLVNISWNWSLVLTSTLASLLSISPYIFLASNLHGNPLLSWLFPSLRALGSLLCVVSVQFALQRRIHHIARGSLLLSKARKGNGLTIEEAAQDAEELLEARLQKLLDDMGNHQRPRKFRALKPATDPENNGRAAPYADDVAAQLRLDIRLLFLQVLLLLGMGMIVAGYVGCFNLVSRTEAESGPYIWLGMETFLCVLRIILWGSNPSWDEKNTGMMMRLNLLSQSPTPSNILPTSKSEEDVTPSTPSPGTYSSSDKPEHPVAAPPTSSRFPLITTTRRLRADLARDSRLPWPGDTQGFRDAFVVHEMEDFLVAATPYVGPLRRLELDSDVSIYYAVVPDAPDPNHRCTFDLRRYLCVTARPSGSSDSISIFIGGDGKKTAHWDDDESYCGFVSHSRDLAGTSALQVMLEQSIRPSEITIIDERTLRLILEYSEDLHSRLFPQNPDPNLLLSWTFATPPTVASITGRTSVPLTSTDVEYMRLGQLCDLKGDIIMQWGTTLLTGPFDYQVEYILYNRKEIGLLFCSAILEIYLCILDRRFAKEMNASPQFSHLLALNWINDMERRLSMEMENSRQRITRLLPGYRDDRPEYFREAHSLVRGLRSLRLSQDPSHLAPCENHITTIIGSYLLPEEPPLLEELLFLYPLRDLDYLGANLRAVYQDGGAEAYQVLLSTVRLGIHLIHHTERAAFGRIDPVGYGSQEFEPPCTFIRTSFDGTLKALEKQIKWVQILALDQIYAGAGTGRQVLRLLESLSAPALTTLAFTKYTFDTVDCATVLRVLKKHSGITCIITNGCGYFGEQGERQGHDREWKQALDHNMREWGRNARSLGEFRYQVGIHGYISPILIMGTGEVLDNIFFRKEYEDIWIPETLEVQVLVYVPCHGKITPALSGKTWDHHLSIDLIPLGFRADDEDFLSVAGSIHREQPIPPGTRWRDNKIHLLPEVPRGYYKIAIHLNQKAETKTSVHLWSFEGLTVEFTPTPSSNETVTRTTGVTESLEAEMWATKDSAQDTTHTQPVLDPHSEHSSISFEKRPPSQSLDTAQEPAERLQSGSPSPGIEGPVFHFLTTGLVYNQAARHIDPTYLRVGNDTPNGQPCS